MIAPARVAAYEVSLAVSAGHADLPDALAEARAKLHDDRDSALVLEIATGVQRRLGTLDYLIAHFARRPVGRLDPEVLEILRLSLYQLLHLTRIPASAVVDDAVNLTGRAGKRSASGLVNAVLRAASRQRDRLPMPTRPQDNASPDAISEYLSVTLSHPQWLVSRWLERYGASSTEAWLRFNNSPAPLTLRANTLRASPADLVQRLAHEHVVLAPTAIAPTGLLVESGQPLHTAAAEEGWFFVQDEASQLVAQLADARPGARLLDTCASPGGKTTMFAERMRGRGLIVACDVRGRRIDLLRRAVASSGATTIRIVQADLLRGLPFRDRFDCVFVDAPCSGLGILRRDPEIRWRRHEADLGGFASRQAMMLREAAGAVRPGGRLVYATCSSEPEENEKVAHGFLLDNGDFLPVDLRSEGETVPPQLVDLRGHFRTLPFAHGLEAFFGAVFVRRM